MSKETKIVGDRAACISLACCFSFWVLFALSFMLRFPLPVLTSMRIFEAVGISVLLVIVALFLQSRLWKFALPFALVMFFFVR